MQKPLVLASQGLAEKSKMISTSTMILQQTPATQQLKNYIYSQSLTDCLTILENSGYTGDLAIFVLANLQTLEVAR